MLLRDVFSPPRMGLEALVGTRAAVTEPLAPVGQVLLSGETWGAESLQPEASIPAGTPVIVRGSRGLTLLVETEESLTSHEGKGGTP